MPLAELRRCKRLLASGTHSEYSSDGTGVSGRIGMPARLCFLLLVTFAEEPTKDGTDTTQ